MKGGELSFKRIIAKYAPPVAIGGGLLVSVPRLAAAFAVVEPSFNGVMISWATGPGYGLVMVAAVLYVWHVYQERKRLKLAWLLLVGWAVLLVLMAIILVPGMLAKIRNIPLAELLTPPIDLMWGVLVALSNELAVGLAAIAAAISKEPKRSATPATQEQKTNGHEPLACPWCGATCGKDGKPFRSQNGVNAHAGKCAVRERKVIAQ